MATWVGCFTAVTPTRDIVDGDGVPTGEVIQGGILTPGVSTLEVPAGEAAVSVDWLV